MVNEELDKCLGDLASEPADHPLHRFETEVRNEIARRRQESRALRAMAPVRLVIVGVAVVIGVVAGGTTAASALRTSHTIGPFDAGARLAPSTLLDGAG